MKARVKFNKYGVVRFIGHLDVMRYFQKAMRRAGIDISYSQGYNPHQLMSFASPLGVGITSDGEYLDIELVESVSSEKVVKQMNAVSVEGIEVISFVEIPDDKKCSGMTITAAADYIVSLPERYKTSEIVRAVPQDWENKIKEFMEQEQIIVLKKTKKSEKEVDIKPMIYDIKIVENGVYMFLATGSEQNLKPDLVMDTFLKFIGADEMPLHFHRLDVYARDEAGNLLPLEKLGRQIL